LYCFGKQRDNQQLDNIVYYLWCYFSSLLLKCTEYYCYFSYECSFILCFN